LTVRGWRLQSTKKQICDFTVHKDKMMIACKTGDRETVDRFVADDKRVVTAADKCGLTPLHWAAREGRTGIVEFLVEAGAPVDARDNNIGWTPLHLAAWGGHLETVQFLVERGAPVDAKDRYGRTPLHWAARDNRLNVVVYLWPLCGGEPTDTEYKMVAMLNFAARACLAFDRLGLSRDMIDKHTTVHSVKW
jgi:ankyrin repeat protein